jgi:hypothetical protein
MAYRPTILPPVRDQRKRRTCLRCDKLFWSLSPAHRICKQCRDVVRLESTPEPIYSLVWPKFS